MQINEDKIVFESRREIEDILHALTVFHKEHPREKDLDRVDSLINMLKIMHMNW